MLFHWSRGILAVPARTARPIDYYKHCFDKATNQVRLDRHRSLNVSCERVNWRICLATTSSHKQLCGITLGLLGLLMAPEIEAEQLIWVNFSIPSIVRSYYIM